jgi:hypothetical protein
LSIYFSTIDEKFTNDFTINPIISWRKNHQFNTSSTRAMMASELIMPKTLKVREKEK